MLGVDVHPWHERYFLHGLFGNVSKSVYHASYSYVNSPVILLLSISLTLFPRKMAMQDKAINPGKLYLFSFIFLKCMHLQKKNVIIDCDW